MPWVGSVWGIDLSGKGELSGAKNSDKKTGLLRPLASKLAGMEAQIRVQGRLMRPEHIAWLRESIAAHPEWSRKAIAREVCRAWDWKDGRGQPKDFAARSLLLKLEARGAIRLPPLRYTRQRRWSWASQESTEPPRPAAIATSLGALRPLSIAPVEASSAEYRRWRVYLEGYHYLGLRVVGENVGYLVRDAQGRDVACLLFGAAAWRCAPRDRHLGWEGVERAAGLSQLANNTRFLILPWVRVPQLASHVLGLVIRRIDADWRQKYGHGLRWLETFVERERFRGTCYRAANWQCVGQTTGRSRQDRDNCLQVPVKDIYLYPLAGGRR
jgi:hypothetical protein